MSWILDRVRRAIAEAKTREATWGPDDDYPAPIIMPRPMLEEIARALERAKPKFYLDVWLAPLPPDCEPDGPIEFGPFDRVSVSRCGQVQADGYPLAVTHDQGDSDPVVRIVNCGPRVRGRHRMWNRDVDHIEIRMQQPEVPNG